MGSKSILDLKKCFIEDLAWLLEYLFDDSTVVIFSFVGDGIEYDVVDSEIGDDGAEAGIVSSVRRFVTWRRFVNWGDYVSGDVVRLFYKYVEEYEYSNRIFVRDRVDIVPNLNSINEYRLLFSVAGIKKEKE